MPLLEAVGMTPTDKNFTVATAFMRNEQATTYRWVLEQIKHLYVSSAMSIGSESILNDGEPIVIIIDRESRLMPVIEDVFSKSYHILSKLKKNWLKTKRSQLNSPMAPVTN
ncbi:hypothetical protein M9H77_22814 [Catharanthus roseus]|uniref:Uncharacterized protein n=1 Tax=Catharanthus roseus TaxID=4058 RepID=A0ACC0ARY1_CATRO|nr:hypothetical protein M9H77_22814 [Catharanthus roseus]